MFQTVDLTLNKTQDKENSTQSTSTTITCTRMYTNNQDKPEVLKGLVLVNSFKRESSPTNLDGEHFNHVISSFHSEFI